MGWDEALATLDELDGREPPRRDVLVPAHRPDADQAQQPHPRRGRAARRAGALVRRRVPLQPRLRVAQPGRQRATRRCVPRLNGSPRRALSRARATATCRTRSSPRRATSASARWSTPCRARPASTRCARCAPGDRRAATGGSASRSRSGWPRPTTSRCPTASGRDTMYLAFHIQRADRPHRRTSRASRILRGYDGRPHWGKLHTRDGRRPRAASTRAGTSSWRCATGSTPTGCSPTTTSTGCSATEPTSPSGQTLAGPRGSGACQPRRRIASSRRPMQATAPGLATSHGRSVAGQQHRPRGPDQGRGGVELAGEHDRHPAGEQVPRHAAADAGDHAHQRGRHRPEAVRRRPSAPR